MPSGKVVRRHDAWVERGQLPDALASDEQPITSPEICVCGDYRSDHVDGTGRCRMPNDMTHGFEPCREFRSAGSHTVGGHEMPSGKVVRRKGTDKVGTITVAELLTWVEEAYRVSMCCRSKCDKCQASGAWLREQMMSHIQGVLR